MAVPEVHSIQSGYHGLAGKWDCELNNSRGLFYNPRSLGPGGVVEKRSRGNVLSRFGVLPCNPTAESSEDNRIQQPGDEEAQQ